MPRHSAQSRYGRQEKYGEHQQDYDTQQYEMGNEDEDTMTSQNSRRGAPYSGGGYGTSEAASNSRARKNWSKENAPYERDSGLGQGGGTFSSEREDTQRYTGVRGGGSASQYDDRYAGNNDDTVEDVGSYTTRQYGRESEPSSSSCVGYERPERNKMQDSSASYNKDEGERQEDPQSSKSDEKNQGIAGYIGSVIKQHLGGQSNEEAP